MATKTPFTYHDDTLTSRLNEARAAAINSELDYFRTAELTDPDAPKENLDKLRAEAERKRVLADELQAEADAKTPPTDTP
jgi:hypothetical protein